MSTPKSSFRRTPQKIFFRAFLCTVYLLTIAVASFAQSDNSSIAGVVTDPSGAVVANASITLTNEQNGAIRKVATNRSGFYTIPGLAPGKYTVMISAEGVQYGHNDQ